MPSVPEESLSSSAYPQAYKPLCPHILTCTPAPGAGFMAGSQCSGVSPSASLPHHSTGTLVSKAEACVCVCKTTLGSPPCPHPTSVNPLSAEASCGVYRDGRTRKAGRRGASACLGGWQWERLEHTIMMTALTDCTQSDSNCNSQHLHVNAVRP